MSIRRDNVVAPSLDRAMPGGFVNRRREYSLTRSAIDRLAVKTPTLETPVGALSGGSQQKVLLARGRLGDPRVLLVEDPTQGVDAGARVEIYAFLREMARSGVAVVVLSTDAVELEGLCDRVLVFSADACRRASRETTSASAPSRAPPSSPPRTAPRPGRACRASSAPRGRDPRREPGDRPRGPHGRSRACPPPSCRPRSSAPLNVSQLLAASAVLVLVGLAQLLVVMTGGIDLSIGSVAALSAVVVSFFGQGGPAFFLIGIVCALAPGSSSESSTGSWSHGSVCPPSSRRS